MGNGRGSCRPPFHFISSYHSPPCHAYASYSFAHRLHPLLEVGGGVFPSEIKPRFDFAPFSDTWRLYNNVLTHTISSPLFDATSKQKRRRLLYQTSFPPPSPLWLRSKLRLAFAPRGRKSRRRSREKRANKMSGRFRRRKRSKKRFPPLFPPWCCI